MSLGHIPGRNHLSVGANLMRATTPVKTWSYGFGHRGDQRVNEKPLRSQRYSNSSGTKSALLEWVAQAHQLATSNGSLVITVPRRYLISLTLTILCGNSMMSQANKLSR